MKLITFTDPEKGKNETKQKSTHQSYKKNQDWRRKSAQVLQQKLPALVLCWEGDKKRSSCLSCLLCVPFAEHLYLVPVLPHPTSSTGISNSASKSIQTTSYFQQLLMVSAIIQWNIYQQMNWVLLSWLSICRWSPALLRGHENDKKWSNPHFAQVNHLNFLRKTCWNCRRGKICLPVRCWLAFLLLWLNCRRKVLYGLQQEKEKRNAKEQTSHKDDRRKLEDSEKCLLLLGPHWSWGWDFCFPIAKISLSQRTTPGYLTKCKGELLAKITLLC